MLSTRQVFNFISLLLETYKSYTLHFLSWLRRGKPQFFIVLKSDSSFGFLRLLQRPIAEVKVLAELRLQSHIWRLLNVAHFDVVSGTSRPTALSATSAIILVVIVSPVTTA